MHELGMCASVVTAIEDRAGDRPVARVGVRVGALLRVVPESFEQAFTMAAGGTVADGASPELTVVPVACTCTDCGTTFESFDGLPACPGCNTVHVEREGGDDLVLEWIEYRQDEPAAAATGGG